MNDHYTYNDVELAYRQARILRARFFRQLAIKLFTRKPATKTTKAPLATPAHA